MADEAFLKARGLMTEALGQALAAQAASRDAVSAQWLSGLEGPALALWALERHRGADGALWVILPSDREAAAFHGDLESLRRKEQVEVFPETGIFPYEDLSPSPEICRRRVRVLDLVARGEKVLVCSSLKAVSGLTIPPSRLKQIRVIWQTKGGPSYREALECLASRRYVQVSQVRDPGEYAMRGEIIDFWSPAHDAPTRLTYFDETLEEIREFNSETQRTVKKLGSAVVLPLSEWNLEEAEASGWCDSHTGEAQGPLRRKLKDNIHFPGIQNYTSFLHEGAGPAWDFLPRGCQVVAVHPDQLEKASQIWLRELWESRRRLEGRKGLWCDPELLHPPFQGSPFEKNSLPVYAVRQTADGSGAMFHLPPPVNYRARVAEFLDECQTRVADGWRVFVTTTYPEQVKRLGELLFAAGPKLWFHSEDEEAGGGGLSLPVGATDPGVHVVEWTLSQGMVFPEHKLAVVADYELFGRKKRTHRHYRGDDPARILESFIDLKEGDHVVHINHGIGIYRGLHRRAIDGREKDYLKVEYLENAALYIPVEQVNLIQKYIGAQGRVSVDALGGKAWDKVKQRVKKAVADIAAELIGLYAARRSQTKTPYPPDTAWQYEFESGFEYEETPDQLKTIEAIKRDMESGRPMDRLVCGDVGFGKTEVALRAIFKAALASRQTAVLVPTTILSEQHLHNFRERFRNYPVRVEAINRFRSVTEVRAILRDVAQGKVDVLIGTHRLLSKDVGFRDLGLLVVDEEQKFGVKHKEAIRARAALVDTLTLSATPIPRTLHLSMINIRDISVINTAPADRLPVETWLSEFDEDLLIQAIGRETGRGGQIYFVHNHIEGILSIAEYLRRLFPTLRIEVGHGQMEEHVLEGVMDRFIRRESDILVCTTIIDSGLDLSNANTLFVNHVEHFGLSQLYQLRGRVGRSERQGYAYFFHPKDRALPELAQKRLQAITDFVELGSGLKVAMRDLELRGAGNVLGAEQSGDVMAVGFEMYCQLLDEAVQERLGEAPVRAPEAVLDLKYHGYIPDHYIPDPRNKIEVYKRIGGIRHENEIAEVVAEIEDRYGRMPELIQKLVALSKLRVQATGLRVVSVLEKPSRIEITFSAESRLDPGAIPQLLGEDDGRLNLVPGRPEMLSISVENQARDERDQTPFEEKIARVSHILTRLSHKPPASTKIHETRKY